MVEYRLSNTAKEDLIRIHHYGIYKFGQQQADKYFNTFFEYFEIIAERPFAFESVDYIKPGYRRCVCGVDSIFYRIENDIVDIMAIVGRQDINQLFIMIQPAHLQKIEKKKLSAADRDARRASLIRQKLGG